MINTDEVLVLTDQEKERLSKIEDKKDSGIFEAAFCGHFSAGKSTLLNALLGAEVLPTSPIPTSANIIKISKGAFGLQLIGDNNKLLHSYEGELPWHKINEWGREGEDIRELHIQAPLSFLSDNGVIVDTPGVDSTDPTHAKVTTEQLYSTDTIVYVMDYNHVQSETNLHFLKQLSEAGKPIFIVINQIDKHDEKEVSLEEFRSQIDEIFEKWHIRYAGFYLTTMKEQDHPLNEFQELKQKMKGILRASHSFTEPAQAALKKGYYEALAARVEADFSEQRQELVNRAQEKGFTEAEVEEISTVKQELAEAEQYEKQLEDEYEESMKRLYENVHLFPYTTTELLERYVESKQRTFKVGLLFSAKKTKEEQEKRLNQLTVEVNDNLKSQLLYYVEDYFREIPVQQLSNQTEFLEAMKELDMTVSGEWIDSQITTNATNREYVYTLSKKLNDEIVRKVRQTGSVLLQLYIEGLRERFSQKIEDLTRKQEQLSALEEFHAEMTDLTARETSVREAVKKFKPKAGSVKPLEDLLEGITSEDTIEEETFWHSVQFTAADEEESSTDTAEQQVSPSYPLQEEKVRAWTSALLEWQTPMEEHILFKEEAAQLRQGIYNYEKSTFTISLFGAFSAGKSSFANALLGADIMPVSPHPTTATINTIQRASDGFAHGDALIQFKDRTSLSAEIASVARTVRENLDIDTIAKWNAKSLTHLSRQQRSVVDYLQMLQSSIRNHKELLGTEKKEQIDNLSPYVADETMACLIQEVTMYYNCPLTEQGIILVDTPGVNSIHGRHTNIAFQQMEASDAIFYLTYYNHAFSKADQYFLQQLNSVNESFSSNKMYFVINASDLADSQKELAMVKNHVETQLKQNGFQEPNLYHVSSREALKDDSSDTTFKEFEQYFYENLLDELKKFGVQLIQDQEMKLRDQLTSYETYMKESSEERTAQLKELISQADASIKDVKEQSFQYVERDAHRELEQLSLYLRKRMSYVLNDYYLEAINVSVFSSNNKKELQTELSLAVLDWAAMGEQFLKQEWEAVSIRLDYAIQRLFRNWCQSYEEKLQTFIPDIHIVRPSFQINMKTPLSDVILIQDEQKYKGYLRSKKDFFEGGRTSELKTALVQEAVENITFILQEKEDQVKRLLNQAVEEITIKTREAFIHALYREIEKYEALMSGEEEEFIGNRLKEYHRLPNSPFSETNRTN